jgi:GT2 family glycosyltransferase
MARVLVVSLNYRTADMTLGSAKAALEAMEGMDADLVIVDNDSGDGSFELMQETVAREGLPIRVIQSGHNGGFGAGNNVGMRQTMADGGLPDYFYLLNSDAYPEKDAIRTLVERMEAHPEAGMAGSATYGQDGVSHRSAFRFPSILSEIEMSVRTGPITKLLNDHKVPLDPPEHSQPVDWLVGASLMLRRKMLDEIGLFDERFFLYFEETDLCMRAARAGYESHFVMESRVMHVGSASTGMGRWQRVPGYWLDSRWHYFSKNHGRGYAAAATLAHVLGGLAWRFRILVQGKEPADPPRFLRDLIWHDLKAVTRPLPRAEIRKVKSGVTV